jgi:transposase IS66-like protein
LAFCRLRFWWPASGNILHHQSHLRFQTIEPEAYLRNVLARIGDYPSNRLHGLLPWNIAGQATRNLAA